MHHLTPLPGRVAIVTGGAHGIGAGIVRALAEAGATVAVFDRNLDASAEALVDDLNRGDGGRVELYPVDVAQSERVNAAVDEVVNRHAGVDILVNNAGICPFEDLEHITDALWHQTLEVNLSAMFFLVRALLPNFRQRKRGAVVNISTVSTSIATPHQVHYIASKAGVDGLTRALAVALAPYRVRVNAVAPGGVETDINRDHDGQRAAWQRSGVPERTGGWQPIARPGTPEEMAAMVRFLVSDQASYITGAIFPVDGGALIV